MTNQPPANQNAAPQGFKRAERKHVFAKIAITGPSGSGKTYSALEMALGMAAHLNGKVALIDTENGSASLYSDRFEFDVIEMNPPYSTGKFVWAIGEAIKNNYDVVIVDSATHQWKEILNKKEQMDGRGGDRFTNWAKITPEQEQFLNAILHSKIHLIATMRSKQEYAMVDGGNGKNKVQKLGLAPVQRDGVEYEFTTVFDVAMNHEAETSKDRTGLYADRIFKISRQTGDEFMNWLKSGKSMLPKLEATADPAKVAAIDGNVANSVQVQNHRQEIVDPGPDTSFNPESFFLDGPEPTFDDIPTANDEHEQPEPPPPEPKVKNMAPVSMGEAARVYELSRIKRGWNKSTVDFRLKDSFVVNGKPVTSATGLQKWQYEVIMNQLEQENGRMSS